MVASGENLELNAYVNVVEQNLRYISKLAMCRLPVVINNV